MSTNENSRSDRGNYSWILTALVAIIVLLAGGWAASLESADRRLDDRTNKIEERVTRLEQQFSRIDTKLDTLIEQHRNREK